MIPNNTLLVIAILGGLLILVGFGLRERRLGWVLMLVGFIATMVAAVYKAFFTFGGL